MAYVIIGNSAAGIAAAERIRRYDREKPVIIITDEQYSAYSRCLTSYYLAGQLTERDMYLRPADFYDRLGIDLKRRQKVVAVDQEKKVVVTDKGQSISYTKLLVAAGASPKVPVIPGINSRGVYQLRTLDDAKKIAMDAGEGKNAVILGGGLVSLKAAAALWQRKMQVTVLVSSNQVMSQTLDQTAAGFVESKLKEMGITVKKQTRAMLVENRNNRVTGVRLAGGEFFPADIVVVGKGVRPNTGFFLGTDLVNEAGAPLRVNRYQQTADQDIYAAGDVALTYDLVQEDYTYNAIWPNAVEQGAVAGENMAGISCEYAGSISMNSAVFGGLSVIAAGITRPGSGLQVLEEENPRAGTYKKLVFAENRLVGYILVGDTARAGLYTGLIKSRKKLTNPDSLLEKPRRFLHINSHLGTVLNVN
ncbi:MAG: NAD(P)/FAD-dependent oxidoreductase [Thermoanaerobacteraceae bacterium]|nr:NAD(P)/FAD-dependent oxidoreductase [Thermoanaerobacteraceae bacterium]